MNRQDQKVSEGSLAIQAQGNVIVSQGLSSAEIAKIVVALSKELIEFQQEAMEKVEKRLEEFHGALLERFAGSTDTNSISFQDPDFQYVVRAAQTAYARSGEPELRDALVEMIAQRSLCNKRDRRTLVINAAIEIASILTVEEFAVLSVAFMLGQTKNPSFTQMKHISDQIKTYVIPFLDKIEDCTNSCKYLEAQNCLNINTLRARSLSSILRTEYSPVFSSGFSPDEFLKGILDSKDKSILQRRLFNCVNDGEKVQFFYTATREIFLQDLAKEGLSTDSINKVDAVMQTTTMSEEEISSKMLDQSAEYKIVQDLWNNSLLKCVSLTPLGIAIAHCNCRRSIESFEAELNIWIK